jgi:hypothetical protein
MKPVNSAVIELRDLQLRTDIGTYGPLDTRPDIHLLDLTLGIGICLRKAPVRRGSGVLGVRLPLNQAATQDLRHSLQNQR